MIIYFNHQPLLSLLILIVSISSQPSFSTISLSSQQIFHSSSGTVISHLKRQLQILPILQACNVIGCQICSSLNQCQTCIDKNDASIIDGRCICRDPLKQKPDSIGQCATCLVPGCASCLTESEDFCFECSDPTALLRNGVCFCPETEMIFNGEGLCHKCEIAGCERCLEESIYFCLECIDREHTVIEGGKCVCKNRIQKPNFFGFCSACIVPGCSSCVVGDQLKCFKCADPNASLQDNKCACPLGQQFNKEGFCVSCRVPGCNICSRNNPKVCLECIDTIDTRIIDGLCTCRNGLEKIDSLGQCSNCLVPGCASCISARQQACYRCIDPSIEVEDNKCYCESGMMFNRFGLCHRCEVIGCDLCSRINECARCIDSDAKIINGKCQCQFSTEKPDPFGQCATCFVPGCQSCQFRNQLKCFKCADPKANIQEGKCVCPSGFGIDENGLCLDCLAIGCNKCVFGFIDKCEECIDPDSQSIDGKCVCDSRTHKPNSLGYCFPCFVEGCASCLAEQQNQCSKCLDPLTSLEQGLCICPFENRLNSQGFCHRCTAVGCDQCTEDNQNMCISCIDSENTAIIRGNCHCVVNGSLSDDERPNSQGFCQLCTILGCGSCLAGRNETTQQCIRCLDDDAFLVNGSCVCPVDIPLQPDGYCLCTLDFCLKCSRINQQYCIECQPFYNPTVEGKCVPKQQNKALFVVTDAEVLQLGVCSSGCFYCLDFKFCLLCEDGYFFQELSCYKCHHSCRQCFDSYQDNCTVCYQGFYLAFNSTCQQCTSNCITCDEEECFQCRIGYFLKNSECIRCPFNCKECDEGGCAQCQFGSTLTDNACVECLSDCGRCVFEEFLSCENCGDGFYSDDFQQCEQCPENCLNCTQSQCYQCIDQYVVNDGVCVKEQPCECAQCNEQGCTSCFLGYQLKETTCQPFLQCQTCLVCPSSYVQIEWECVKCQVDENCLHCSDSLTQCIECVQGYYIKDGSCQKCKQQCSKCITDSQCLGCAVGYYEVDRNISFTSYTITCEKCAQWCMRCVQSSNLCLQCAQGYFFQGWKCLPSTLVSLVVNLQAQMQQFIPKLGLFREELVRVANKTDKDLTIHSIVNGSVTVNGSIGAQSAEQGDVIADSFASMQDFTLAGFNILQIDIKAIGFNKTQIIIEPPPPPSPPPSEEINLPLILGLAIGGFVLLVLLIVIICCCCCCKKKQQQQEEEVKKVSKRTSSKEPSVNIIRKRLKRISEERSRSSVRDTGMKSGIDPSQMRRRSRVSSQTNSVAKK